MPTDTSMFNHLRSPLPQPDVSAPGHTPQSVDDAIGNLKVALLILELRTAANKLLSTDEVGSMRKAVAYLEHHLGMET